MPAGHYLISILLIGVCKQTRKENEVFSGDDDLTREQGEKAGKGEFEKILGNNRVSPLHTPQSPYIKSRESTGMRKTELAGPL